jgi:signal transduction histidine kinase
MPACSYRQFALHLPLTLEAVAPSLAAKIAGSNQLFEDVSAGASGAAQAPFQSEFISSDRWAGSVTAELGALTARTQARATALVAADRRSYSHSRDLLIAAGAGSLLLALALGLLLSDSLLVPLRKTQKRLAAIAAGDFSGHVEVPNRDEIGALAADVNRMSDELQRLYQELETASRHKSDFLATMSHELRTPLNAIIGFSEVLQEEMFGELNERQLAYVNEVLEAGKHLLSLINDVLDLAKIEAGSMELELSEVAIPEVLRSAVSMHSERASRGGIELSLATEPEEIAISADGRRVRQVVFNLLSNAVKFTPAEGRVDVSARLDDGQVEIAVADTGPGIAPEELETIFEEFKQARDGKRAEGTGLGLPLSRKLVELHGGRLWVESAAGNGSTFRFTLPVSPTEPASALVASGSDGSGERALS